MAIAVQFEPIKGFRQAHLGLFWNQIRADYPVPHDQPRLDTPIEIPGEGFIGPSFQLELIDAPPVHRAWFVSADESLLVQVQDDRLIHNWRHRGGEYPRFEPLLDRFWGHVDGYQAVVEEGGLSLTPIQQAEVTYINWIAVDSMEGFFRPSTAGEVQLPNIGPRPDMQRWAARYPVLEHDRLVGRMVVETQPGQRLDQGKAAAGFQLALTFRAPVAGDASRDRVSELLTLGRDAIVRTFTEVTTETMHEEWGRTR